MFNAKQRAFLRAASKLWLMAASTSKVHPSEVPAIKAEFFADNVLCPTTPEIEALIHALEIEVIYTTVTLAAEKYKVPKSKLTRKLAALGYKPVPGSHVYSMHDVVIAVTLIREKESHGFFGKRT